MLNKFLLKSIDSLKSLIEITKLDIGDIKKANHDVIFERMSSKNECIESFEANKNLAHEEMVKIAKENPNKSIAELLDSQSSKLIDEMRDNLKILKELNENYAKSVFAVNEFYNSLIENIIPSEKIGYSNKTYSKIDLLRVDA